MNIIGYRKLTAFITVIICITLIALKGFITGDAALDALVDLFLVLVGGNIGEYGINTYKSLKDAKNNSI